MAVKPSIVPQLDTNGTNRIAPVAGKISDGYAINDILPSGNGNYLWGTLGDWVEWLDERTADGAAPNLDFYVNGVDISTAGNAGDFLARGGDASDSSGVGGLLTLRAGSSGSAQSGPLASLSGGQGGTTGGNARLIAGVGGGGAGGAAAIFEATGTVASGTGGSASVTAGNGVGTDKNGGQIFFTGGNATGSGVAGALNFNGGVGVSGNGGSIIGVGGTSTSGNGGDVSWTGGASAGGIRGGNISFVGGAGSAGSAGGSASLIGGAGDDGGDVIITGGEGGVGGVGTESGDVLITSGSANANNTPAGDVVISCGSGFGTHTGGTITVAAGDGVGVDQAGGNLTLSTGQSTGTGSAVIDFKVTNFGGTGSSLNSTLSVMQARFDGVIIGGAISNKLGDGLHIFKSDVVGAPMSADADNLVIEENGNSGISIISGGTSSGRVNFGDNAAQLGYINYAHTTDQMALGTNGSDGIVIDSVQRVGMGTAPSTDAGIKLHLSIPTNNTPCIMRLSQTDPSVGSETDFGRIEFETSETPNGGVNAYIAGFHNGSTGAMGLRFYTGANDAPVEAMRIGQNSLVSIGDVVADAQLHVQSASGVDTMKLYRETTNTNASIFLVYSDVIATETNHLAIVGDGDVFNSNGFYGTISDERLKKDIKDMNVGPTEDATTGGCDIIKALRMRQFRHKSDQRDAPLRYGIVVQEVPADFMHLTKSFTHEKVDPNWDGVSEDNKYVNEELIGFNYTGLIPFNTKAIQELIAEVAMLKTQVAALQP